MSNFSLMTFKSLICKIRKPPDIIIGFEYSFNSKPNKAFLILEFNEFSSINNKKNYYLLKEIISVFKLEVYDIDSLSISFDAIIVGLSKLLEN